MYRIGQGIDFHRFSKKRKMIIGGVEISCGYGLEGHSDADVLIHALMDACLGAAGLRDIGYYFPDTDDTYKDADSLALLSRVMELLAEKKFYIVNMDITVMAQVPKLSPFIPQMIERISEITGSPQDVISIKATTTEKMGSIGRQEGIAASAVILLQKIS